MPEDNPEFRISLASIENITQVIVEPALSTEQINDVRSSLEEIEQNSLIPWTTAPLRVLVHQEGDEDVNTKMIFKNTNHFGAFQHIYGESGAQIIRDILELDGLTVELVEKVESLSAVED